MSTQNFISNKIISKREKIHIIPKNKVGIVFLFLYFLFPFFAFYDFYFDSPFSFLPFQLFVGATFVFLNFVNFQHKKIDFLDSVIFLYYFNNIIFALFSFRGDFNQFYGTFIRQNLLPIFAYLIFSRLPFSQIKKSIRFLMPIFISLILLVSWLTIRIEDSNLISLNNDLRPGGAMVLMLSDLFVVTLSFTIFKKGKISNIYKKIIALFAISFLGSLGTFSSFVVSCVIASKNNYRLTISKVLGLLLSLFLISGACFFVFDKYLHDNAYYSEKTVFSTIFRMIDFLQNPEDDPSFVGRSFFWALGLDVIRENPLTGEYLYQNRLWAHHFDPKGTGGYIHNFVSIWAEYGLLSFLLFLTVILSLILRNKGRIFQKDYDQQVYTFLSMFFIMQMLFFKPYSWYSAPLLLGFSQSIIFQDRQHQRKQERKVLDTY